MSANHSDDNTQSFAPLTKDTLVGHYRIIERVAAGGMGEVYRAEDTNLSRQVAIKVLPALYGSDTERLARFGREAKLLASLNHPNLATVYGFENVEGKRFLVMELVEGETLTDRVARGPLPLDDALEIFRQIAAGMEAAHEKGIVHRDLKPANIKITPDGKVKILDFGLAKALQGDTVTSDLANSPPITQNMTRAGVILGTAAYMSPEQAKGRPVDKRTDIWAFGCILYRCLTGKRAFEGETVSETLAAVLTSEPNWDRLPKETPAHLKSLLHRCLQKNSHDRLRDIGDACLDTSEVAPLTTQEAGSWWRITVPWAVAAILLLLVIWGLMRPMRILRAPNDRSVINLSLSERFERGYMIAFSPDGRKLAYVSDSGGTSQLFLRDLDKGGDQLLIATRDCEYPFFSPDGKWVAFTASGELFKLLIAGGKPIALCQAGGSGTWGNDDTIFFSASWTGGLWKISAEGGQPLEVTKPNREAGECGHYFPRVLPDGGGVLFTVWRTSLEDVSVEVLVRETGERRTLVTGGSDAHYVPTGHIVYAQMGTLMAAPFDLKRLRVGEPRLPVIKEINQQSFDGSIDLAFSPGGTLLYVRGGAWSQQRQFVWLNRSGKSQPLTDIPAGSYFYYFALSPDGRRLAFSKFADGAYQVWTYNFDGGRMTQMTFRGDNYWLTWSPDGRWLAFGSLRLGPWSVWRIPANLSRSEECLLSGPYDLTPECWSPDGHSLLYDRGDPKTRTDIWRLSLSGDSVSAPILAEPYEENGAELSPSGKLIAYNSNQTGRYEVYVRAYPELGGILWNSSCGASHKFWSHDGRELFFSDGERLFALPIVSESPFRAGTPAMLFEGEYTRIVQAPNGRFLALKDVKGTGARELVVVFNWFDEFEDLVPGGR